MTIQGAPVKVEGKFEKQPAEILDYDVDYTEWFGDRADTPESYVVVVPVGITKVSDALTGNVVKVVLGGGTAGTKYKITVRLTTASGLVKESDFELKVKEV